jgi:hypothetical protein
LYDNVTLTNGRKLDMHALKLGLVFYIL